ncbi:MAG: hypothetical protein HOG89_05210 [Candidatus Peribacter sp.]|jgi:hypothetical protein|nr:hypothetical protein [Candidatus Peribacter sp.]MBT4392622.1 hypothetical protein [Candidatus Peribacter sp.]MBT5149508.1 hypothetical protein [Candidatus Peribacter sp.]MBT5638645.1 hypothetical protein [Candidatus Peribacter sp.]MBT5938169.1 hypothetical protein [Candidatus Peribacter sp.]
MPKSQKITACLLSWKRPENMQYITDHVLSHPFIDEVIIWNNDSTNTSIVKGDRVKVINSPTNVQVYGRYLCAYHAKNDIIYTQDDDWISKDLFKIYTTFQKNPDCITHGLHQMQFAINQGNIYETAQMSFVGWGALYQKKWLQVFNLYIEKYGYDELLFREADRIFSILLNRRHTSLLVEVEKLSGANDERALWRQEGHRDMSTEAVRRALSLIGKDHLDPVSPIYK